MLNAQNPAPHAGILDQFLADWQGATASVPGRGDAKVEWRPYAGAALRALRRLVANLELVEERAASAPGERDEWTDILAEARRLAGAVPLRESVDQDAVRTLWAEVDALIVRIRAGVARETAANREAAGESSHDGSHIF